MAAEKQFENKVKKFLTDNGCWVLKYWAGAAFTQSGIPDLLVCCNGYFVAIELKAPNGKPSDLQKYQIRQIKKAGGVALVLYPNDFEEFKKFIGALNSSTIPKDSFKNKEKFQKLLEKES